MKILAAYANMWNKDKRENSEKISAVNNNTAVDSLVDKC